MEENDGTTEGMEENDGTTDGVEENGMEDQADGEHTEDNQHQGIDLFITSQILSVYNNPSFKFI